MKKKTDAQVNRIKEVCQFKMDAFETCYIETKLKLNQVTERFNMYIADYDSSITNRYIVLSDINKYIE